MINIHELSIGNVILIGCDRAVVTSLTEKFVNGIYVGNQLYPIPLGKGVKAPKYIKYLHQLQNYNNLKL